MTDPQIRSAIHSKRLRLATLHPNTLVIDELGLAHGKSRIDIAVINGHIHGYEIKSNRDNLNRLTKQFQIYRQSLHKLTVVTAPRHLQNIESRLPTWCGLVVAERGLRSAIHLRTINQARQNPDVDPVVLAHLLWKSEVIDLLVRNGFNPKSLYHPRKRLYEMLCQVLDTRQLTAEIRISMLQRRRWRDSLRPPLNGD